MRLTFGTAKPAVKPAAAFPTCSAPGKSNAHQLNAAVYADLLGKPFAAGGRGPAAFDCVGIALELARRLGKTLPSYVSSEAELHAQLAAGGASLANLPQIARPVAGCIALLRIGPNEHHVAFMLDEFRMIHTTAATGCVIERINSNLWQRKVMGFYSL